ncbi:MAG: hypothetical protein ACFCU4_00385 [Puniceicoccaceae bacterium]
MSDSSFDSVFDRVLSELRKLGRSEFDEDILRIEREKDIPEMREHALKTLICLCYVEIIGDIYRDDGIYKSWKNLLNESQRTAGEELNRDNS